MLEFILNDRALIQIESRLNEEFVSQFRVVTFFRITHKVHVTKWYTNYSHVKVLFDEMIKTFLYDYNS